MKFTLILLLATSMFAQYPDINVHDTAECVAISDSLYDENWVLLHHIDYGHDKETKVSINKLRGIIKAYDTKCVDKNSEYSHTDIQHMRTKLDKLEKSYKTLKYFNSANKVEK